MLLVFFSLSLLYFFGFLFPLWIRMSRFVRSTRVLFHVVVGCTAMSFCAACVHHWRQHNWRLSRFCFTLGYCVFHRRLLFVFSVTRLDKLRYFLISVSTFDNLVFLTVYYWLTVSAPVRDMEPSLFDF